ncbi:secreted RxLR effector protein 161-like [Malania oleifera]|uniref:secreted RxLR effector protein 161-like n=1 Tax=Malania oleifera TaxID=397392 RepID=UPI0025AE80FE|nr:secreted RxLR effector protein 161-like [Malania oleifera]
MVGYMDANYAGDLDDKRSTIWYVFSLVGGPICWRYMVQSLVALSTTESEYMAVAEATKEALWVRELIAPGELLLEKVHMSNNAVDMLSKRSTTDKHFLNLINVSRC